MKRPPSSGGWRGRPGSRHERGYGTSWDKLRLTILARDGHLCQPCRTAGRYTPARTVDHIIPRSKGGTDDPENLRAICDACHAEKTAAEGQEARKARSNGEGFGIPQGLKPAACPVFVIAGPPASGKTTYAHARAREGDTVIDVDDIAEGISGQRWTTDIAVVRRSLDERDWLLSKLHTKQTGRVYLIVTAPSSDERKGWLKAIGMRARLLVIQTAASECIRRIKADPARAHVADAQIGAVQRWR